MDMKGLGLDMTLSVRVAEEVMGWRAAPYDPERGFMEVAWIDEMGLVVGFVARCVEWWFDVEIQAAWLVVERLLSKGFHLQLEYPDNKALPANWFARFYRKAYADGRLAYADTAPKAICLAALAVAGAGMLDI